MKKFVSVVLVLVMAMGILAGCGKPAAKESVNITIKNPVLAMECVTDSEITASDQFLKKAWDAFAAQYEKYDVTSDIIVFEQTEYEGAITECYETDLSCDLCSVDDVEVDMLASDDCLCVVGDALEGLLFVPEGVEKEAAAVLDALEHVILFEV